MTHLQLRDKYLSFWTSAPRNHVLLPSSSLVPENDPTTLFTGSGMQPMMPYLLGATHPLGTRLVDIQKCFRGQDIDEVGDNRHDSFFEMLGNWSLGDYFKKEQITWFWEFLTKDLKMPKENLYVSVFGGEDGFEKDVEAIEIWKSLGVAEDHIFEYGAKKNWWSRAGGPKEMPIGEPGGPDSEVFFEFSHVKHDKKFGEECHPNCDCGRFIEIGNNVFMTYLKTDSGFVPLEKKNIDFGGGLERIATALNGNPDQFVTDLYLPIIKTLEKISGIEYGKNDEVTRSYRIIADHIKSAVFLISAGVTPSNVDRGYILRRLIRRVIRFGKNLGINEAFIDKVVASVIEIYQQPYPELKQNQKKITEIIVAEEAKFQATLERGLRELEKISAKGGILAEEAFYLYESFGFPYELTEEEAKAKNLTMASKSEFDEEYKKHKDQSRNASQGKFKGGLADHSDVVVKYHTATHLLQAALRKVLGDGVHQEGSNLTGERLRFDFSHGQKLTPEEIEKIEKIVNEQIENDLPQKMETMTYDEAIKSEAMAFFKERYPEKVTVYSFGDFSKEICGGPHVERTGVLGKFKITKEEAVASGIRRIYAVLE